MDTATNLLFSIVISPLEIQDRTCGNFAIAAYLLPTYPGLLI